MAYDRQIASALRQIAAKGQACRWHKPAAVDPASDSWRDVRTGDPEEPYDVSIAWFPPDLQTQRFLANSIDGIPEGFELGYMGAVEFEVVNGEQIERATGEFVTVFNVDRIAPDGTPILYTLWVKR